MSQTVSGKGFFLQDVTFHFLITGVKFGKQDPLKNKKRMKMTRKGFNEIELISQTSS